ncbi:MAG: insulinase family protein [Prevotellaceae bacterium]|jgi:predicted Zn-dependent peptidase|nr:insulinase family protein [Prevotellaceae bacterium]
MKKNQMLLLLFSLLMLASCGSKKYEYESVPNDPLNVRIYTLENGMKVYFSVNKDRPRIQTYIGVRVGGKNDPAETTGLAHYFEHLMFKGTQNFGTTDYEAEKPMLDEIEALFEIYRKTSDETARKAIYAKIDSVSQEASKIAIPNEYDKLMSTIGSQGTNAFTSYDVTAYVENIPNNEIENWAKIEADRFRNPVIRLFHTELETVYEEKNMSLTNDDRKSYEAMLSALFPHHPYGTQTVLGTQEHLKNPSITNIKNYFDTYYVPNNMAIIMVGDFDPDETIKIIDNYFGSMVPKEIPELTVAPEEPITAPIEKEVVGLEAENISIAFRMPAANHADIPTLELVDYILTNGKAGLIDLNLNQKQQVLSAGSYVEDFADNCVFTLYGAPKKGQTLDEVRNLLLSQLEILKKGEFDENLLKAVINNFKLNQYYQQESPGYVARIILNSFVNGIDWKAQTGRIDRQSELTKQDIVDFCNKYFGENYAVVYKREGKPNDDKLDKPQITPIATNRDEESAFLAEIKAREVQPIEPLFLDYSTDLSVLKAKQEIPILYKQNSTNPLFSLNYVFEMGNNSDNRLGLAFDYLDYLGTSEKTAEQIKSELYEIACSFSVSSTNERVYVSVSGLHDNFDRALALLEQRLADPQVNEDAFNNLVVDILKSRGDEKLNQRTNFARLRTYAMYGKNSPATNILSEQELKSLNPQVLTDIIKNLKNFEHKVLYYGPLSSDGIVQIINDRHATGESLQPPLQAKEFPELPTEEGKVLLADYDANQIYMASVNKGGSFDRSIEPDRNMYNEYFGGGMNSIVFQEMREARGLAYSANAQYARPSKPERSYYYQTFIATQNDKMTDAILAFDEIVNKMPASEKAFDVAKEGLLTSLRTGRILRASVLWTYLNDTEFGYTTDSRKDLFDKIPAMTLQNVVTFQEQYVKDKPHVYCILGRISDLDISALEKLGTIQKLTQEEIYGY